MSIFCSKCGNKNRDASKFCSGCASPLQASTPGGPLRTGTILENRYKIITLVKTGGMGAVYKALDTKFDSICAIKELLPPYGATPLELTQYTEWFKREAKLLHTLHHTNLPKVSDYFIYYNRYYLVMTFVEGEDLETILARDGKPGLPQDKVVEWAKDVLLVLEYIHNQKPPIVYRDIKPGNIMINKDGKAMLIDFGIARIVRESSQTKKTAIGTQGYAPVEQCRGQVEPRSDLYALGATMHHLLTGIEPLPFKFDPPRKINPKVSAELEDIIMKALKDNLNERFSSAKEMREALLSLSSPSKISKKKKTIVQPVVGASKQIQVATSSKIRSVYAPEMVLIPAGTFMMGSKDEQPVHKVTLDSFYMGKYPVTNREYHFFKAKHKNPGDNLPVVVVSWEDAVDYCKWLSKKEGVTYRLPTEAEWEYACRAGTTTKYYWGDKMDGDYCWFSDNSGGKVHPVGQKKPNAWGLYDMSGNVWEWCNDWYGDYPSGSVTNPTGPAFYTGPHSDPCRVMRGGSCTYANVFCQSACRRYYISSFWFDNNGFRLVRTL